LPEGSWECDINVFKYIGENVPFCPIKKYKIKCEDNGLTSKISLYIEYEKEFFTFDDEKLMFYFKLLS
jgi:hypothetical protein